MTAGARAKLSTGPDDTGAGLTMFVVFSGAVLIVTGVVALLALVGSWWMLGLAFAVHVGMTAIVVMAIAHAMSGHSQAIGESETQTVSANRPREAGARRPAVAAHL